MKVFAETVVTSLKKLDEFVSKSSNVIDCYDLPEAPAGYPALSSIALAVYLKTRYGVCSIPHIRLYDVNKLALLTIAKTVEVFNLNALLITRGDPPKYGNIVSDLSTEEAIELIKRHGYRIKLAILVSLRYSLKDILERVSKKADMLFILRVGKSSVDKLQKVYSEAKKLGKEVYAYILIGSERNIELFEQLSQPYIHYRDIEGFLADIKNYVDGVILSSPRDKELIRKVARFIKESM